MKLYAGQFYVMEIHQFLQMQYQMYMNKNIVSREKDTELEKYY